MSATEDVSNCIPAAPILLPEGPWYQVSSLISYISLLLNSLKTNWCYRTSNRHRVYLINGEVMERLKLAILSCLCIILFEIFGKHQNFRFQVELQLRRVSELLECMVDYVL